MGNDKINLGIKCPSCGNSLFLHIPSSKSEKGIEMFICSYCMRMFLVETLHDLCAVWASPVKLTQDSETEKGKDRTEEILNKIGELNKRIERIEEKLDYCTLTY